MFINNSPYFFFCNKYTLKDGEMPENVSFYLAYVTFEKVFWGF